MSNSISAGAPAVGAYSDSQAPSRISRVLLLRGGTGREGKEREGMGGNGKEESGRQGNGKGRCPQ